MKYIIRIEYILKIKNSKLLADRTLNATLLLRRMNGPRWTHFNYILNQGEIGLDLTNMQIKIGDGVTAWNDLAYYIGDGGTSTATKAFAYFLS